MLLLCKNDPLVDTLHKTFRAQPIRVPEARVTPLVVFLMIDDRFRFVGHLGELLTKRAAAKLGQLQSQVSPMADVISRSSSKIDVDLGIKILEGFLRGFNVSGFLPSVSAKFGTVKLVSFTFHDVVRRWIDGGALADALRLKAFEMQNALVAEYLGPLSASQLFIVDSVIASRDFTIAAEGGGDKAFRLTGADIQGLAELSTGVSLSTTSGRELTFTGPEHLPFAFTCYRAGLDSLGAQPVLAPYAGSGAYARPPTSIEKPNHAVLAAQPALLEWE
jgi:hypothetical protein